MASKRNVRRRKCGDKVRHADKEAAMGHLMTLVRNGKGQDGRLETYRCKWCGKWHVGRWR